MLYDHFSSKMYGLCLRFAKSRADADDILQEGFIKVFTKLDNFRNEGSFEGWIRRIMVTTAINYYKRKNLFVNDVEDHQLEHSKSTSDDALNKLSEEELINLISDLPNGYRMVFNLNVIEGYTHKEIGSMMNISSNTSKSQLTRAKISLQKKLAKLNGVNIDSLKYTLAI